MGNKGSSKTKKADSAKTVKQSPKITQEIVNSKSTVNPPANIATNKSKEKTPEIPPPKVITPEMVIIKFMWYPSPFIDIKLNLSSMSKILSYYIRNNNIPQWIDDITEIINDYFAHSPVPMQYEININNSFDIKKLKEEILIKLKLNKSNILMKDIYIYGYLSWDHKLFDDKLLIKNIEKRFDEILHVHHIVPHKLLNTLKLKLKKDDSSSSDDNSIGNDINYNAKKQYLYIPNNKNSKMFNVHIGNYSFKILLPFINWNIQITNSDLRIILFDLINPYLKNNYNGCNDKNLPFKFDASWRVKMRNNQFPIPNNNEFVCVQAYEFTLRFDKGKSNEVILPVWNRNSVSDEYI